MATLTATHPPPTSHHVTRATDRGFSIPLVTALSLLALLIDGYHPYAEDGGLYMAGVKRLLDPTLYPHGTAFVLEPTRFSFFAPAIARLVRISHLGLPSVLLLLHLATIWLTLYAAWLLACRCWTTRPSRAGAVTLLACWLNLPIAGTALLLMDPYLTARSFSTPCMVLALVGILDATSATSPQSTRRRGVVLWFTATLFATAMHPLMAAYTTAATLLLIVLRSPRPALRTWGPLGMACASLALAALVHSIAPPESPAYLRIALTRSYWFIAQWRWYELAGLAAPIAILLAFLASDSPTARTVLGPPRMALCKMAITLGATAIVATLIFARADSASHLVARLQPLRCFQIVYLLMILELGAALGERLLRQSTVRWIAALPLLAVAMLVSARMAFPSTPHLESPWLSGAQNPWVKAFLWVRENTPTDALFAMDADYINRPREDAQCFRALAERSALADYSKDGGEASISPSLTPEWTAEQSAQKDLDRQTDAQRSASLRPFGVTWVILGPAAETHLVCPYRDSAVQVCRLPSP